MGEGLFDEKLQYEDYVSKYFDAAFGKGAKEAREYLENISKIFDPVKLRSTESVVLQDTGSGSEVVRNSIKNNPETEERLKKIAPTVDAFMPTIEKYMTLDNSCHKESWKILFYHAEYCRRLAEVYITLAKGDVDGAKALKDDMIDYLSKVEDEIQPYFDLVLFNQRLDQTINQ
jgi:hypothetical protein